MNIHGYKLGKIIDSDGRVNEGIEIQEEARYRASILLRKGIESGDRVLICHGGTGEFFTDLLATWYVGGCAICVNEMISEYERQNIIEFTRPKILLRGIDQEIDLDGLEQLSLKNVRENARTLTDKSGLDSFGYGCLDQDALVLFTSGTTDIPKGVVHTFRSILARLQINRQFIGVKTLRKTVCPLPTHFGHGLIGNCLTPWFSGCDVYLFPLNNMNALASIGDFIDDKGITFLSSVPSMWEMISRVSKPPCKRTLERINVGSAPLSKALWNKIINWSQITNVANMYGITETANWVGGASAADHIPEDGLVGNIWFGNVMVEQESGQISNSGRGEILIQTASIMRGYLELDDLTNSIIKGGMFWTGDIGHVNAQGEIRLVGRKKLEINRAGVKINPEELDNLLQNNELVSTACAFAVPDQIAGELVGVALVLANGSSPEMATKSEQDKLAHVKTWIRDRLIEEKVPDRWYVVEELPTTDRGKIDRVAVASLCKNK